MRCGPGCVFASTQRHRLPAIVASLLLAGVAAGCSGRGRPADVTGWDGDSGAAEEASVLAAGLDSGGAPGETSTDASDARHGASKRTPEEDRHACLFKRGALPAASLGASAPVGRKLPIDHVVVLVQENRSFDSYFSHLAKYQASKGHASVIDGAPDTASNPSVPRGLALSDAGAVVTSPHYAVHAPQLCILDTPHDWNSIHLDWDFGRNDGFYFVSNGHGGPTGTPTGIAPQFAVGDRALWWYDERDIPFYYDLFSTFGMADHYHSDVLGPTYPNRMFLYAGTSFGQTDNYSPDLLPYPFPGPDAALIFDELESRHVTWSVYSESPPASAQVLGVSFQQRYGFNPAKSFQAFLDDASSGNLPAVSFLDSDFSRVATDDDDEHPPADIQLGQHFVWSVVQAVTSSPNWSSTALFVTYDEAGGLYDHVSPPRACNPDGEPPKGPGASDRSANDQFDRYGIRVPLLVVSPYVKKGYVSHSLYSHASILRFIETRLDGPALSSRDANADPFLDMFDWENPPFMSPPSFPEPAVDQAAVAQCKADLTPPM